MTFSPTRLRRTHAIRNWSRAFTNATKLTAPFSDEVKAGLIIAAAIECANDDRYKNFDEGSEPNDA